METKHTPAPWIISEDNSWECAVLTTKEEHFIEVKNTDMEENGFFEMQANAKLISAAPDLLEALLLVDKKGVSSIYTTEEINKIKNAINKATK